jgi:1-deoxy-D-xylulose-5-phosphate reductoisomerase
MMNGGRVNFPDLGQMSFFEPDPGRFPALRLAYDALEQGGTAPAVLNAANEVAVHAFLDGQISFPDISGLIEKTLSKHPPDASMEIGSIMEADRWARETTVTFIGRIR